MKILIIGNGYLGNRCLEAWSDAVMWVERINSVTDVESALDEHEPDVVLNAAGVVGKPNVDWCETHQTATIWGNSVLPMLIAEACQKNNTYLLHVGTGCIFYGYSKDKLGWKESDFANPVAVYTKTKYTADLALSTLPNVGIARIRMPIDNRSHPGNLINKLASYSKIVDVTNSVTIVPDMIITFRALLERRATGIFHCTNPGAIKHKEILEIYTKIVDPNHSNTWITEEELVTLGLANKKRSNNILQSTNLEALGITMRPVKEALEDCLLKYKQNL